MLGGSPIKGYIAAMAGNITGIDEHTKLKNAIQCRTHTKCRKRSPEIRSAA
ncbi:hypothetical protein FH593_02095 [Leptospira interrogans]|nr:MULTISPECIES: hypothetical protein [Leptospira]EKO05431.1 hypothetical protein LEP1GSC077_4131 [Leptospira interrogans str. C10069]ULG84272.1 hypothetical protein FH594_18635 [Leptospira interrogans]ULG88864.1 hypothetical protein FH593_02095 [Leptospira interrogans]UML75602.1 hypothetical protein FH583_16880 [Leptospira interrogans]